MAHMTPLVPHYWCLNFLSFTYLVALVLGIAYSSHSL